MSFQGWVKLHRKIQDHWIYQEKRTFSRYEAWLDLIMMANHREQKMLIDNELLTVKRGQSITSIRKLCDRWNWSNTKVRNFLEILKEDEMIVYKSDTKKTTIGVVNYDLYHEIENKKHHENDSEASQKHNGNISETHKQEYKELKELKTKEEETSDSVIQFLIDNKIVHENG